MCTSKRRFLKEGQAITYAINSRLRGHIDGSGRVYKCVVCLGYHVTKRAQLLEPAAANG